MAGNSRRRDKGGKGDTKKFSLDAPIWPDACPTKHTDKIMSIVAGNTHLNWAVHEGESNGFTPILFWRTPPLHPDEKSDDPCEVLARHLPPQAHAIVFGDQSSAATRANAVAVAAMRRVPTLSVFVISTNDANEQAVGFLFQDVPSRLFKLRSIDFFDKDAQAYDSMGVDRAATLRAAVSMHQKPALVIDAGTALTYTGMDRSGKIIGGGICPGINSRFRSLHDYCGALPRIDFEEYKSFVDSMNDSKDTAVPVFSKDTKQQIMVNVFTEVAFKCRSAIQHFLKEVGDVQIEEEKKSDEKEAAAPVEPEKPTGESNAMDVSPTKPTPTDSAPATAGLKDPPPTAADVEKTSDAPATGTPATDKPPADSSTAESASKPAPMETEPTPEPQPSEEPTKPADGEAVDTAKPAPTSDASPKPPPKETAVVAVVEKKTEISNAIPSVTLTGGDAAFLEMLLNLKHLNADLLGGLPGLPDPNKFEIRSVKHLIHYGVSAVLTEKFKLFDIDDPDQELRQDLVGLRIAKKFDQADRDGDFVFRGSVLCIKSDDTVNKSKRPPIEADLFNIRYDDGDTEDITLVQLYSALVYYQEVGEKTSAYRVASEDDVKRKKVQAEKMAAHLIATNAHVKEATEKLAKEQAAKEAAAKEAEAAKAAAAKRSAPSTDIPSAKKAKLDMTPTKSTKESFIGRRVAKLFPMEDDKGKPIRVIFFGVIDKMVDDSDDSLWHVLYDDDDEEEYDEKDVKRALRLYEKEKGSDNKAPK